MTKAGLMIADVVGAGVLAMGHLEEPSWKSRMLMRTLPWKSNMKGKSAFEVQSFIWGFHVGWGM